MGFNSVFKGLIKLEFFRQIFGKKNSNKNFMKIRSVRAELFNADERTHRQTRRCQQSFYANFSNASENAFCPLRKVGGKNDEN